MDDKTEELMKIMQSRKNKKITYKKSKTKMKSRFIE
jgi:hypothetical protein